MAKFTEILNRLFVSKNWILRFVQPIPVTIMGSMAVDRASFGVHRPPSTPLTPDPDPGQGPTQDARDPALRGRAAQPWPTCGQGMRGLERGDPRRHFKCGPSEIRRRSSEKSGFKVGSVETA